VGVAYGPFGSIRRDVGVRDRQDGSGEGRWGPRLSDYEGPCMTTAIEFVLASDTDKGSRKPFWERQEEERRRRDPALTDAQLDEFRALLHQL
jgi:hypothetical protein